MIKNNNGWGGNSIIQFQIKRFLDKETGKIIPEESIPKNSNNKLESIFIDLEVFGSAYHIPGYICELSNSEYLDEEDSEINSITGPNGEDWKSLITDKEQKNIMDSIIYSIKINDGHHHSGRDYYNC